MILKKTIVSAIAVLAVLALTVWPSSTHETHAIPGNLYTYNGQWAKRSEPGSRAETWSRTEWGMPFGWLVRDVGKTVDAWYVKMDTKFLVTYCLTAVMAGAAVWLVMKRLGKNQKREPNGCSRC